MLPALSSSDRALAERLEAVESANLRQMARALERWLPGRGAAAEPVAGGVAVFAGVDSPMTHAVGIGMRGPVSRAEFDGLEEFFRSRNTPVVIDLCPMTDPSVLELVQARGYRVLEFNNVMARRIGQDETIEAPPGCEVRVAAPEELEAWSRVVVQGFEERDDVSDEFVTTMSATCSGGVCFVAPDGAGGFAGGAALGICDRTACFYGDSTLVRSRGRGLQSAFIRARLAFARDRGCDLAMASVLPGSGSHRNYERAGFQLVYMRVNVILRRG